MAISIFPAPAAAAVATRMHPDAVLAGAGQEISVRIPVANTNYLLSAQALFGTGIYRIRAYNASATFTTLPTLTWQQINAAFANVGGTFASADADSGNTFGFSEQILNVTTQVGWNVQSNVADTLVVIQRLSFQEAADFFSVVQTVATSGPLTLTQSASCVLLGGGGGGANAPGVSTGGGGGGSGFQTRFSLAAGTYNLVLGAGGAGGSVGGTSTIHTFSAAGGNNGGGFGGGSGGSGGGAGGRGGDSGGGGGSNGGSGGNTPNNNSGPGGGSGVGLTGYLGLVAGAGGGPGGAGGAAGGVYAGGGGGGSGNGPGAAAAPTAYAAGGGGAAGFRGTDLGGTGGNGVLYFLRGF